MNKKYILIIVLVITIIAIVVGVGVFLNKPNVETTNFNDSFISGAFVGKVVKSPTNDSSFISYKDENNSIEYNMSTCKNSSFLIDYFKIQGLIGPETRDFNGIDWNIYFTKAVSSVDLDQENETNSTDNYDIFICQANENNQSYLIYVISTSDETYNITPESFMFSDLYLDYIEPFLENVKLKKTNAPEVYTIMGISESEYNLISQQMELYKAGNLTA